MSCGFYENIQNYNEPCNAQNTHIRFNDAFYICIVSLCLSVILDHQNMSCCDMKHFKKFDELADKCKIQSCHIQRNILTFKRTTYRTSSHGQIVLKFMTSDNVSTGY